MGKKKNKKTNKPTELKDQNYVDCGQSDINCDDKWCFEEQQQDMMKYIYVAARAPKVAQQMINLAAAVADYLSTSDKEWHENYDWAIGDLATTYYWKIMAYEKD